MADAALELNVAVKIREVKEPESIVTVDAKAPTKFQTYPVATPDVVVAAGNRGAV